MAGPRPHDMVEVTLDDDLPGLPDADAPAARPSAEEPGPRASALRRARAVLARHPRRLAAGALVVTLAVAGSVVAERLGARERTQRFEDVAGVVLPLGDSVTTLWTLPSEAFQGLTAIQDGRLLVLAEDGSSAKALDADTGQPLWDRPVEVAGEGGVVTGCSGSFQEVATTPVVCVIAAPDRSGAAPRLASVDLDDGTWSLVATYDGWTSASVVGSVEADVVVLLRSEDGRLEVRRHPADGGGARWVHEGTWAPGALTGDPLQFRVVAGVVDVTGAATLALDATTGEPLDWWPTSGVYVAAVPLPDGARAVWSDGADSSEGAVHERDGSVRFALTARPLTPFPDDHSVPSVLLMEEYPEVLAVDVRSGEELWRRAVCTAGQAVRLEGSLLCTDRSEGSTTVRRIDLTSGEPVWTATLDGDGSVALTDGFTVVAAPSPSMEGAPPSTPFTVRFSDGAPLTALVDELPSDAFLLAIDRRLYAATPDALTRLG